MINSYYDYRLYIDRKWYMLLFIENIPHKYPYLLGIYVKFQLSVTWIFRKVKNTGMYIGIDLLK